MPTAKVHVTCGAIAGFGSLLFTESPENPPNIVTVCGRIVGGAAGGLLPDKLEPAIHPRHRQMFHSVAAGGGLSSIIRWAYEKDRDSRVVAEQLRQKSDSESNPLMCALIQFVATVIEFIGSACVGIIVGYLSHIALDLWSPASIPVI